MDRVSYSQLVRVDADTAYGFAVDVRFWDELLDELNDRHTSPEMDRLRRSSLTDETGELVITANAETRRVYWSRKGDGSRWGLISLSPLPDDTCLLEAVATVGDGDDPAALYATIAERIRHFADTVERVGCRSTSLECSEGSVRQ